MASKRTFLLIILDGWGIGPENETNPIHTANLPVLEDLARKYPLTSLEASGINVGLPWGEAGNSEVGHLTMGAGKILYQHYPRISLAIRSGDFFENKVLKGAFAHAKKHGSTVHFVGLLCQANTHASFEHVQALIEMAHRESYDKYAIQGIADGKDSAPRSILALYAKLSKEKIGSLVGRYYGMDREQNWRLTQSAYEAMTGKSGVMMDDPTGTLTAVFGRNQSEEFLPPIRLNDLPVRENDAVIFFNFREDSIRQITEAFIDKTFDKFPAQRFSNLFVSSFTKYEEKYACPVAFPADTVINPLGRVLSDAGMIQLRLAETHKYAHTTYFFNGLVEPPFKNELRVIIPSLQTSRPEEHPEMMAAAITDRLLPSVEEGGFDFILVNFANPDTMAHTGVFDAGVAAAEIIDREIGRIMAVARKTDTLCIITSDHGNLERMVDPMTGRPETQHDSSPVPFYLIADEFKGKKFFNSGNLLAETGGNLADIAPTILRLMDIKKPAEMTGQDLLDSLM